jgi:hypothetical protein
MLLFQLKSKGKKSVEGLLFESMELLMDFEDAMKKIKFDFVFKDSHDDLDLCI